MYLFTTSPEWIVIIFSLLCLFQVRCWFEEIIESFDEDQKGFTLRGQRFTLLPNRSFIVDESLKTYGVKLGCNHKLN